MKKKTSPMKKVPKREATPEIVDNFLQHNFYNSFFSLYNPKHSNFQIEQLDATAPSDGEGQNEFNSPLASYLIKEDCERYKKTREETFEDFEKLYPKICQEIIDPSNDIPIAFVQKF